MLEFFVNLLIFILIFFFFVFIFSIILYFIFKIFYKLKNKTKTINFKTIFKKFTLFLLPVYLLLFLAGGCSYKYMDPQYYEFRSLCKDIDNKVIIYNKAYWEIFSNREKGNTMHDEKGEFFFNQKINKKIYFDFKKSESINVLQKNKFTLTEVTFENYYDGIHYSTHLSYIYNDYGIFLGGDEGAGFYFRYHKRLYCEDVR